MSFDKIINYKVAPYSEIFKTGIIKLNSFDYYIKYEVMGKLLTIDICEFCKTLHELIFTREENNIKLAIQIMENFNIKDYEKIL